MSIQRFSLSNLRRHTRNSPEIALLRAFASSDSHCKPSAPSNHNLRHHNHGHRRHFLNSLVPSQPPQQLVVPYSVSFYRSFSTRDDSLVEDISDSAMTQYDNTEFLIGENVSASVEEAILPVRTLMSLLDGYHDLTGFPWWIIIASSTVVMRLTLFPFVILQLHKLRRIGELFPKLPPPLPPPMSGRRFRDQLKIFFKEKRAAGCPSFLWYFASLTVQVPCFLLWITTIRRMSLDHHKGFDCLTGVSREACIGGVPKKRPTHKVWLIFKHSETLLLPILVRFLLEIQYAINVYYYPLCWKSSRVNSLPQQKLRGFKKYYRSKHKVSLISINVRHIMKL